MTTDEMRQMFRGFLASAPKLRRIVEPAHMPKPISRLLWIAFVLVIFAPAGYELARLMLRSEPSIAPAPVAVAGGGVTSAPGARLYARPIGGIVNSYCPAGIARGPLVIAQETSADVTIESICPMADDHGIMTLINRGPHSISLQNLGGQVHGITMSMPGTSLMLRFDQRSDIYRPVAYSTEQGGGALTPIPTP